MDVVTWPEAIDNVYQSISSGEDYKYSAPALWLTHNARRIPRVRKLMDKMNMKSAHMYFNAPIPGDGFGRHRDDMDIWFWQCQGSTKWTTERGTYILQPGDVLFILAGTVHQVVGQGPRIGISMSL